jgi:hypothetical protein
MEIPLFFLAPTGVAFIAVTVVQTILRSGAALFSGMSEAVLSDGDAQEAVGCCLYNTLAAFADNSRTNFKTALDSCDFEGGSLPEQIRGAIAPIMTDTGVYYGFLKQLGESYRAQKAGLYDTCPCDTWEVLRLGGDGNANISVITGLSEDNPAATYNAVDDRYEAGVTPTNNRVGLIALESATPFIVTEVEMSYHLDFSVSTERGQTIIQDWISSGIFTPIHTMLETNDVMRTITKTGLNLTMLDVSFRWSSGGAGGFARITKLRVKGRGFNPFA